MSKKKSTSARRRSIAAPVEDPLEKRKAALDAKIEEVQKEARELEDLRRAQIMERISAFSLQKPELDSFHKVFSGMPGRADIANLLITAAVSEGEKVNMDQFQTKLLRMGLL